MTHVSLHRCRFVDYPPSSITSIAFSHPSVAHSALPPPKTLRVAIGRNNGSIEIWNPLSGKWHHETTLQGGKDRSIEGLVWIQDYDATGNGQLRLLSIGYSSVVTEWDLSTGRPAKHLDCNGGAIWSIAAQPRRNAADVPQDERDNDEALAQNIVVGTDDGTLKLLSTAGGKGQLAFVKNLTRAGTSKSRVLSLVWKDRYTVAAGMADSQIRVWDIRSGRSTGRMSLNRERGKEVLVWAVKVTANGDIVSGDSRGEVRFWDGTNYTLKQRMKAHDADCLTLEVGGQNGDSVISGGADMKTVLFRVVGKGRGWAEVARRRFHKHDVRAMAAYESGAFSVVVSGGVDMTPIIIPFRGFTTENHRTLPLVPQNPIVTTLPDHRILMSFWEREVKIWKVEELSEVMPTDLNLGDEDQGRKLLSRIILGNEEYITSADLVPLPGNAGYLLAVSTIGEVKLFCLRNPKQPGAEVLRVQRIALPATIPLKNVESEDDSEDSDDEEEVELPEEGARYLQFTPDGKRLLIITPNSRILMANLEVSIPSDRREKPVISISSPVYELDRKLPPTKLQPARGTQTPNKKRSRQRQDEGTHSTYMHTIVKSAFSSTSRLLAVGDLAGNITTFSLSDGTWSRIATSIPRLPAAPVVLSFRPAPTTLQITSSPTKDAEDEDSAPDSELLVLPADTHIIHLFSATSGRLTQWSQQNPMPDCLPVEFAAVGDRAVGAFWEGTERAWCFGASWVWMFDFSRQWPDHKLSFDTMQIPADGNGKRKRGGGGAVAPVAVGSLSGAGSRMSQPMGLVGVFKTAEDSEDEEDEFAALMESDDDEDEGDAAEPIRKQKGQKPYWGSYRYRSLLGFLPVGRREVVEMAGEGWGEQGLQAVEMVIVERPAWDVGLPPRFFDGKS
ncbi:WD40-repeat-containing domain protein [Tricharina praecox]|uniref:WD40-repeat-containing domain protein n=1 Tax=Tricharina praecox TaxID=43433 RepID=UPI00221E8AE0|nr:WD40-repeat-containing domain protein [Tricharina praecox]KAI5858968.1 WD40-repeat-containing domain protein [Tricharina praecox]